MGKFLCFKVERLTVLLYHFRRLSEAEEMKTCAAKLTSADFVRLKAVVESIQVKSDDAQNTLGQREIEDTALVQRENKSSCKAERKLAPHVSLDSDGYPKMFADPEGDEQGETFPKGSTLAKGSTEKPAAEPSFLRRRQGKRVAAVLPTTDAPNLQNKMGFAAKPKKVAAKPKGKLKKKLLGKRKLLKKKPAAAPAAGTKPAAADGDRKPWYKLFITYAKAPERAYMTGSMAEGKKKKLMLEISRQRSELYKEHSETILAQLKERHLTKAEAVDLRGELCKHG